MIKIDNISFSYGDNKVIRDFSLSIEKGERICLYGESGCGKTTVLRLILGLETPKSGEINGLEDKNASVVFQEDRLLPFKSVLDNITLIGATEEKAREMLNKLGLNGYENSKPDKLSGGMKRRVAIARSLSADFDYLVLDEPFNGLDTDNIASTAKLINEIAGNRPIIMVTHSLNEAEYLNAKIFNMPQNA